jgi:hypothetical protein
LPSASPASRPSVGRRVFVVVSGRWPGWVERMLRPVHSLFVLSLG